MDAAKRTQKEVYRADTCEPLKAAARRGEVDVQALSHGKYPGRILPRGVLREVCSVGYWDAPRDQHWGLDWHYNEGLELTYVARGQVRFNTANEQFLLRRGDLTITRPWQIHRLGQPHVTASRLGWLILDIGARRPHQPWQWPDWVVCTGQDLARLTELLRHNERPVWKLDAATARVFDDLVDTAATDGETVNQPRIRLCINALVVAIYEMLQKKKLRLDSNLSSAQHTVELFLQALPTRLKEPWTLDTMAEECGLARTRFAYYCTQVANMTPQRYLAEVRVAEASKMLARETGLSITDVAFECGFESSQYFATAFRRIKGISPRECRSRGRSSS